MGPAVRARLSLKIWKNAPLWHRHYYHQYVY